ncbi:MAG TPA: UDP-N-acetylmuramate--L-alanine ligase [Armatimonadota bacterium]
MTEQYHFIGVGGIGMSGLARIELAHGARVSGSDQVDSPRLHELRAMGAAIVVGHSAENAPEAGSVVVSDAIHEDNPELQACIARGLRVIRRSELLGEMMARHDGIAISGTHGKTTTTAMVATVMLHAGLDPTVVVGGDALGEDRNAHAGTGSWFVAEACEAYGSYLHLAPRIAVVTNVEPDHLDHHQDFAHIQAAFRQFAGRILAGGALILNADDAEAAAIAAGAGCRSVTYGLGSGDWRAKDVRPNGLGSCFTVWHGGAAVANVELNVPGQHNVSNALAAFVASHEAGVPVGLIAEGLAAYKGVSRRFEPLGTMNGVRIYDDYAHHPTEIRATLDAARTVFPEARILAVFQPHLYSRTRDFMDGFIAAFDGADAVAITEIYKSREEPIPGVRAEDIVDGVRRRSPGKTADFVGDKANVPAWLSANANAGDVAFVMGAGDICEAGEAFVAGGAS